MIRNHDWTCRKCDYLNFGYRINCLNCGRAQYEKRYYSITSNPPNPIPSAPVFECTKDTECTEDTECTKGTKDTEDKCIVCVEEDISYGFFHEDLQIAHTCCCGLCASKLGNTCIVCNLPAVKFRNFSK